MNLVTVVLVCFIVASVPVFLFSTMLISGERGELKKVTELNESGTEVEARLVSLTPINTRGTASVVYEFQTPTGTARHLTGVSMGPAHVVGDPYPLVYDPRNVKRVHMGTKAEVRKERRFRQGAVRVAQRTALLSFGAGVLATIGLIVSPS